MPESPEEQLKLHQQYIRNQRNQLEDLRGRLERLESLWAHTIADPQLKWLYENRSERMDPNVPIFDPGRAEFHLDRYRFAAERIQGKRVADIACGTGYGSRLLKESGAAKSVVGVDIDSGAVAYAESKHGIEHVTFRCAPGEATKFNERSFDAVVSFETIEHVPDEVALLNEFARILKPGGLLICSTPNGWPLEIAPHHVRVYDRDSFVAVLAPNFESIELFNQNSGTSFQYNHDQPKAIVSTTDNNQGVAECFIAVCRRKQED